MITVFVDRPIGTSMGALAVALLGVAACLRLPVDLLPSLELPRISVEVRLEDASAAEVEELIAIPVEQALSGAPGVQEIDSVSRDGIAVVSLAFPWRTDVDLAILNVRERLDEVRDLVPEAASPPAVRRWDPGNRPFLVLAASTVGRADRSPPVDGERDGRPGPGRFIPGDTAASSRLIALSRAVRAILRPRLEQIDGVASAELVGDLDQRVLVEIDPVGARLLDVAPGEIAEAIRRAVTVPESGTLRRGPYRYSLRVPALVQSVADFETIVVSAPGVDPRVRLGDVARTTVAPDEPETVLRFDRRPAVGIRVYKEAAANALAVTDLVHRQLEAFRVEQPSIRIDVAHEQAGFIRAAVGGTLMSVLLGGVLAFGVLFCFLGDWRQPVVIGVVVPVAVLGALAAMDWLGVSINLISLGGLALGIGLLVNTAIIVVENVHRHRERGLAPAAAAVAGTAEVVAPITGVTITTLVIFLPVLAAGGFAGALFRDQAIAVVATVTVAWVAALTLVPALSTRLAGRRPVRAAREPWTPALRRLLTALLRRRRTVLVGAAILVAAGAVLAVRAPREVAPPVDTGDLSVVAEPRHHMAIEQLALAAARLEDAIGSVAGSTRVLATAGVRVDNALTGGGSRRSDVRAQFHADDTAGLDALGATLEHALPGFDVRVEASETPLHDVLGLLAGPVDVAFSGSDLAELRRAVDTFTAEVVVRGDLGRIVDAPLDPERQIRLDLDHRALAELGLSTAEVAEQVGYATRGETVAQLRFADPPLPVVLRRPLERGAAAASTLDRISVVPPRGPAGGGDGTVPGRAPAVPLRDLGTAASEAAAAEVIRRDHRRTLTLGVDPAGLPRVTLEARLNEALDRLRLPTGIRAQVRTRHAEAAAALASLRWVLLVSLVLVVLCLSAEFESVRLALVVLLAVPLTLSGVAVTWWVFGLSINLFTGMAAAALIGIGVDDAVLMVDFMRRKHRDAPPGGARSAIVEAALQRVRPILMTTVTTVLAVAPLALTSAPAQELQRALALTLIGGLAVGAVLSICFVPLLYELLAPANGFESHVDRR